MTTQEPITTVDPVGPDKYLGASFRPSMEL
jgi:hypothetical protein